MKKIYLVLIGIFVLSAVVHSETRIDSKSKPHLDVDIDIQATPQILLFAGSLRETSLTKKLVREAGAIAESLGANVKVIQLNDYPIPFYNEDEEFSSGMPENAKKIRDLMLESQIIIIASPNYNKSFPAVVKNVLDWTSRDENAEPSRAAYKDKMFALMSASSGAKGGAKGLPHLKDVVDCIGGTLFAEEFICPFADKVFDDQDNFVNVEESERLQAFMERVIESWREMSRK